MFSFDRATADYIIGSRRWPALSMSIAQGVPTITAGLLIGLFDGLWSVIGTVLAAAGTVVLVVTSAKSERTTSTYSPT